MSHDAEISAGGEVVEVGVGVEKRGVVADADGCDQAVECPSMVMPLVLARR
jgi:hypothetical protein